MTHTPGPWKTTLAYDDPAVVDYDGTMIAMAVMDEETPQELETIVANARLIAAAPELLDALKQLYEEVEESVDSDANWTAYETRAMKRAKQAIDKAEGRGE